jgi:hypothetical protein
LLEDFDHLYRNSALLDRMEGKDANEILQGYTDIVPGRPTRIEHRAPRDDMRDHYDRNSAKLITKLHAAMLTAAEYQTHDYYMNIGPTFSDSMARAVCGNRFHRGTARHSIRLADRSAGNVAGKMVDPRSDGSLQLLQLR